MAGSSGRPTAAAHQSRVAVVEFVELLVEFIQGPLRLLAPRQAVEARRNLSLHIDKCSDTARILEVDVQCERRRLLGLDRLRGKGGIFSCDLFDQRQAGNVVGPRTERPPAVAARQ